MSVSGNTGKGPEKPVWKNDQWVMLDNGAQVPSEWYEGKDRGPESDVESASKGADVREGTQAALSEMSAVPATGLTAAVDSGKTETQTEKKETLESGVVERFKRVLDKIHALKSADELVDIFELNINDLALRLSADIKGDTSSSKILTGKILEQITANPKIKGGEAILTDIAKDENDPAFVELFRSGDDLGEKAKLAIREVWALALSRHFMNRSAEAFKDQFLGISPELLKKYTDKNMEYRISIDYQKNPKFTFELGDGDEDQAKLVEELKTEYAAEKKAAEEAAEAAQEQAQSSAENANNDPDASLRLDSKFANVEEEARAIEEFKKTFWGKMLEFIGFNEKDPESQFPDLTGFQILFRGGYPIFSFILGFLSDFDFFKKDVDELVGGLPEDSFVGQVVGQTREKLSEYGLAAASMGLASILVLEGREQGFEKDTKLSEDINLTDKGYKNMELTLKEGQKVTFPPDRARAPITRIADPHVENIGTPEVLDQPGTYILTAIIPRGTVFGKGVRVNFNKIDAPEEEQPRRAVADSGADDDHASEAV